MSSGYMPTHVDLAELSSNDCYLCGKPLDLESTPDHIIPDKLFLKSDPERPKLLVHHLCNNKKSKDDEWFIKQLELRCSFNQDAEAGFSKIIDKAKIEKPDAYIIGKKLHNYKLAMGIFNKITWGLELQRNGKTLMQMRQGKADVERFQKYVESMCRGLFIRNVPSSNPSVPELLLEQYSYLQVKGRLDGFIDSIKDFRNHAKFGQNWSNRILYFGSPVVETQDKGFVFIQFYNQYGILASFK